MIKRNIYKKPQVIEEENTLHSLSAISYQAVIASYVVTKQSRLKRLLHFVRNDAAMWQGIKSEMINFFCLISFLALTFSISYAQTPQLTLQTGHSDEIQTLAFSPDGKYLASAGKDNVIIVWDFILGKEIRRLKGHSNQINSLKFLNQQTLVSACGDGMILIWDLNNGKVTRKINVNGYVTTIDISPNKDLLVSSGFICPITIWNLKDTTQNIEKINSGVISNVSFSRTGDEIIYSKWPGKEKGTYIYNIKTNTNQKITKKGFSKVFFINDDLDFVFTSKFSSVIGLYQKNKQLIQYKRPGDYSKYKFCSIAISPNDSLLVCGNSDNSIYILDSKTGRRKQRITHLKASPLSISFYPGSNSLIVFSEDKSIIVWDLKENKMLRKIESSVSPISAVDINYNGKRIAFSGIDNNIKLFDISGGINQKLLTKNSANTAGLNFVSPYDTIASASINNFLFYNYPDNPSINARFFRVNRSPMVLFDKSISAMIPLSIGGNMITMFYLGKSFFVQRHEALNKLTVSNDKKLLAIGGGGWQGLFSTLVLSRNFPIIVFDNKKEKRAFKLYGHFRSIKDIAINYNNKLLASCATGDNYLKIWDLQSHKLKEVFYSDSYVNSIAFSNVNDSMIFSNSSRTIYLFDFKTQTAQKLSTGRSPLFFNKTGNTIFYQDNNYNIVQFDLEKRISINSFSGHNDLITSASITDDGSRLITASWDGTSKLWDVVSGTEIVTFISLDESNFIVKTTDNYYFATKKAKEEIGFSTGEKFYPFEQFDLEYNRPDIILERIGIADTSLINAYRKAYYKRLKKMNFDESMFSPDFHLPEIKVENYKSDFVATSKEFDFSVIASDEKYKLDRINVWLNNVPVFGTNGINLRNLHAFSFKKEISLELIPGLNKIQVSCLNEKGVESLKETFEIKYETDETKPDLYLVTIGTSEYIDSRFNLSYASKDAIDISNLFKGNTDIYGNVFVKTLTNSEVTKENIENLREFISKAGTNDIVMLFISGHGMLDEKFDYYFGTSDIDFDNPSARGVEYSEIESLLDGIKAIKKILFMDTCHSGEVDKEDVEIAQNVSTEFGEVKFRAAGVSIKNKASFGMSNTTEIMKELFTDLRTGTGSTVISSASGVEYAMESDKWKNGLFTFCIINGITSKKADLNKDGQIMLSELQNYVRKTVSDLSDGKQVPTSRIENVSMDFRVW